MSFDLFGFLPDPFFRRFFHALSACRAAGSFPRIKSVRVVSLLRGGFVLPTDQEHARWSLLRESDVLLAAAR